jgi:integrase
VAHYALWLDRTGHEVTFTTLTDLVLIDEYTRLERSTRGEKSAADRRSRLRGIAGALNPSSALPTRGYTIARKPIKPGYTPEEVAAIVGVAQVQPTREQTRSLCAVVGLGLGAGCDSTDLKAVYCHDIHEDNEGLSVTIRSRGTERTVPVMRRYEPLVRRALLDRKPTQLLIGEKADRINVAARIIDKAHIYGDVPKIEASRLRSTWLTELLTRPIPLPVVLHVAGLTSARTLLDLTPSMAPGDEEAAR